jgi:hypothetical protein
MGNALGGSWRGVLAAASVAALVFVVIVGLTVTGRLGDLKYWSFPGHPYPPTGYYINPFNSGDKGDLVNSADAARVKADLLADGKMELAAETSGEIATLAQGDGGRRLQVMRDRISTNTAQGLRARFENQLSTVAVGHLTDPADPNVTWCSEEHGQSVITMYRSSDSSVVSVLRIRFDGKFWLKRVGDRYVIVDALITNTTLP